MNTFTRSLLTCLFLGSLFYTAPVAANAIEDFIIDEVTSANEEAAGEQFLTWFDQSTQTMGQKWCIVGGNRGIGYALAQSICSDTSATCTLFVRDKKKTEKLFNNDTAIAVQPEIVEGDVATDLPSLIEATRGANYIVITQLFPYSVWEECFQQMILNCIVAARENNATLVYYSKILRYGMVNPITETSVAAPISEQGKIMDDSEKLIEESGVTSIIITHPYLYGPNLGDGLLEETFTKLSTPKGRKAKPKFQWIAGNAVKFQFAYTPDLADFTRMYAATLEGNESTKTKCSRINFAGTTVASIDELGSAYCQIAGVPYILDVHSKSKLKFASTFNKEARRALDAYYSFENELLLDNTYQTLVCPYELTPLETALKNIYESYSSEK